MNLTPAYKKIEAVFDSPVQFTQGRIRSIDLYQFSAGDFDYIVSFSESNEDESVIVVSFKLDGDSVTREKVHALLTKKLEREVDPDGEEVWETWQNMRADPWSVLGTGQAYTVFAHVVATVKEYVQKHPVECLKFSAKPESRARLYQSLVRRFFSGYRVFTEKWKSTTYIGVCRPESTVEPQLR